MRLFVAIDLSDSVREAIATFVQKMRAACPSAKWARVEGLHVTLKFIGEVKEPVISQIADALAEVHASNPVDLNVCGTGFFPSSKRPRVFWAGMQASPNLASIALDIDARLEPLGIVRETREFKPHLTLARFDSPRGLEPLHQALQSAGEPNFGSIRTCEFRLYRSELMHGGARYTPLRTFCFASEAAA
ncbi:MAG TPA: RNA 2',3'-cyclic phosphodiesterase [Candidatus Acidoferrales bacterium]|nr:RNA 2',3'-cyclic phosphodiesterase [Candidatus Acidoferrales bacterium]